MSSQDFKVLKVDVKRTPNITQAIDSDTGEVKIGIKNSSVKTYKLSVIVQPNGLPLYPHNQFLYSRISEGKESTATEAQALLAFERFLSSINKNFQSLSSAEEEGAPWLFADYLLDNLKEIDPVTDKVINNPEGYSISTARSYIDIIINFYKWLHSNGIFFITKKQKPFNFKTVTIRKGQKIDQHKMLAHLTNFRKAIVVQTTDLKGRFPKIQSTPSYMKLKPMTYEDKDIFIDYLNNNYTKGSKKTKSLMFRLKIATGLRVEELATLPASGVHYPSGNEGKIPFLISLANGCETKFDKPRKIEIPYELMLELYEYLHDDDRDELLKKGVKSLQEGQRKEINAREEYIKKYGQENASKELKPISDDFEHGRLFINANGLPYSVSTIKSEFSVIRKEIRKTSPHWYYKLHDLRSTFATHWLKENCETRALIFDLLMDELAALMGHESTEVTQKYIDFMNDKAAKLEFSRRKNLLASEALG